MNYVAFTAITCGIIVAIFVAGWLTAKLLDEIENTIQSRRKQKHPELFALIDEYNELHDKIFNLKTYRINIYKENIKTIQSNWNYYTEKVRKEKELAIDNYREQICELIPELEDMYANQRNIHNKIKDYIKRPNLLGQESGSKG